ncbi:dynein regulatory complex subunit 4 [Halichoeres trimaculatus]|uniref:dynein regulatory complex subunit 4 n=1 Tax=Halichoeres trimaculatus TaxID=147232 RepID=UPI003D9E4E73
MPPKAKGKKKEAKAKAPAEMDVFSTEEMSPDQLEEHIVRLREELDREREERSYFQLERDKIKAFWEIRKGNLKERKAELRNMERERREEQERHRMEISVYKQKLKHVMSEQHNTQSELKIDDVASSSLLQHQHTESELALRGEVHSLQEDFRKKMFENAKRIKEMKLKHQVELMELTKDNEMKIREQAEKDQRQLQSELEAQKKKHQAEILRMEDGYRSLVETLVREQKLELEQATQDHLRACNQKAQELKSKRALSNFRKDLVKEEKKVLAAQLENQRLQQSLQEVQQKIPELLKEREENNQAKAEMLKSRARQKVTEKELRDLSMEHELLLQAFEKVGQERDELLKKQTEAILDIQQRSGLKELKLQRKLAELTEAVEKDEARLCAALSSSNVDPAAAAGAANRLQEIFESKDATVSALEGDLTRACQEYNQLLQTSREKLQALGVPLHHIPFRSSSQVLGGPSRVHNSAPAGAKK